MATLWKEAKNRDCLEMIREAVFGIHGSLLTALIVLRMKCWRAIIKRKKKKIWHRTVKQSSGWENDGGNYDKVDVEFAPTKLVS